MLYIYIEINLSKSATLFQSASRFFKRKKQNQKDRTAVNSPKQRDTNSFLTFSFCMFIISPIYLSTYIRKKPFEAFSSQDFSESRHSKHRTALLL